MSWERDNIRYGSACAEIRIRKYGSSLSFTPLVLDTSHKVNRGTYDVKRKTPASGHKNCRYILETWRESSPWVT